MRTPALILCILASALLVGCAGGPTMTPGTQGLPKSQLAIIHVKQHGCLHEWNGAAVHIEKFLVGQVEFEVNGDKDFYVSPGTHTFNVDYGRCVHGFGSIGDDGFFTGPYGEFKEDIQPGAEYLLVGEDKLVGENAVRMMHGLKLLKAGT